MENVTYLFIHFMQVKLSNLFSCYMIILCPMKYTWNFHGIHSELVNISWSCKWLCVVYHVPCACFPSHDSWQGFGPGQICLRCQMFFFGQLSVIQSVQYRRIKHNKYKIKSVYFQNNFAYKEYATIFASRF